MSIGRFPIGNKENIDVLLYNMYKIKISILDLFYGLSFPYYVYFQLEIDLNTYFFEIWFQGRVMEFDFLKTFYTQGPLR